RCRLNLAVQSIQRSSPAHSAQHGLREIRVGEERWIVRERRHRPTLALEVGHAALVSFGGERNRLDRAVRVRARSRSAVEGRLRARSRAASFSKATWLNRARAFRTWVLSWTGSRRRPREST